MDFSLNDIPLEDPFVSLQPDLDDVTEVIQQNVQQDGYQPLSPGRFEWPTLEDQLFHSLPEQEKSLEIGNIVSMLRQDDPMAQFQSMDIQIPGDAAPTFGFPASPGGISEAQSSPSASMLSSPTSFSQAASVVTRQPASRHVIKMETHTVDVGKEPMIRQLLSRPEQSQKERVEMGERSRLPSSFPTKRRSGTTPTVGIATRMSARALDSSKVLLPVPTVASSRRSSGTGLDESDTEEMPDADVRPRGNRTERRSAHNLIEKKYRCSINDKISELKQILVGVGSESRMSKSFTLKKAIDYILYLRNQNSELKQKNTILKQELAAIRGERCSSSPVGMSPGQSPVSPASSFCASGEGSGDEGRTTSRPMMDRSRVTLLVFMLCVVLMNPFQLLLVRVPELGSRPSATPSTPGGRTLLHAAFDPQENESWWQDRVFRMTCLWLLNGIVIACVLARLLIYGEPVTDTDSHSWSQFRRHRTQAELEIGKGHGTEAGRELWECLRVLGRGSTRGPEEWAALIWQMCRHLLHRVWIGQWLSQRRRGTMKPEAVMRSHGEAAALYHRLHQLHLLGNPVASSLQALTLALSAVNLAEAAGHTLSSSLLMEIYVLAALRAKITLKHCKIIERYFLNRAMTLMKQELGMSPIVSWVLHPVGRRFWDGRTPDGLLAGIRRSSSVPFCKISNLCSPMERLTAAFKIEVLSTVLGSLSATPNEYRRGLFDKSRSEVQETCNLLLESSLPWVDELSPTKSGSISLADSGDELCKWWANLVTCAVHWDSGNLGLARQRYQLVRSVPKSLLAENVALALGHAFCARKVCLENRGQRKFEQVVWIHCCKAFQALDINTCDKSEKEPIKVLVMSLVCQWLLWSLSQVWENRIPSGSHYWFHPAPPLLTRLFQDVLARFRRLPASTCQMCLQEVCGRMMSGANPVGSWQMLQRYQRQAAELPPHLRTQLHTFLQMHSAVFPSSV